MLVLRFRRLLTGAIVLLASGAVAAVPVTAGAHSTKHRPKHHHRIPQHNRGDHDGDNRGGPSDGDGNI